MRCAFDTVHPVVGFSLLWLSGVALAAVMFFFVALVMWALSAAWKWAALAVVLYAAWRVTSLARRALDRWQAARDHLSQNFDAETPRRGGDRG